MRVPGVVFASRDLLPDVAGDRSLEQVVNVATLPGIVGASFAMPEAAARLDAADPRSDQTSTRNRQRTPVAWESTTSSDRETAFGAEPVGVIARRSAR